MRSTSESGAKGADENSRDRTARPIRNSRRAVYRSFVFGVKDQDVEVNPIYPDQSRPGQVNDPAHVPIELSTIEYVYVRKQAYGEGKDDDAWKVQIFSVTLYDAEPLQQGHYREFFLDAPNELWLAN